MGERETSSKSSHVDNLSSNLPFSLFVENAK